MKKKLLCLILISLIMLVGCKSNSNKVEELNNIIEDNANLIEMYESEILDLKDQIELQNKKIKELESSLDARSEEDNNLKIPSEEAENIINNKAAMIINLLKEENMEELSGYIHSTKGIRFTPYTTVSLEADKVFNRDSIKNFFEDETEYIWGYYDGSGEDILLKPEDYFKRFVYDEDYVNAETVSYNEVISSNNNIENQFDIYPNSIIVEYYFSGFNPDYAGMDWRSLRIVFEKENNEWHVVGIIHNEWTI